MAQYKVLQDIEAEDKLLGPLTLRQFIYAAIVVVIGFVAYRLALINWYVAIPFLPPIIFFAMLAAPFGHDQSSEVWMLAKIKFFLFPRRRIWNQDGIQELVRVTAPKIIEKQLTKGFSREEARSRLKALANTMDTRGWALKNVTTTGYVSMQSGASSTDRLLDIEAIPQADITSVKASEDVLDANNTPLAQQMGTMVAQNEQTHRNAILQKMRDLAQKQKSSSAQTMQPINTQQPLPSPATPQPAPTAVNSAAYQQPQINTQPVMQAPPSAPSTGLQPQYQSMNAPQPLAAPAIATPSPIQAAPPMTQSPAPDILSTVNPVAPQELNIQQSAQASDNNEGEVVISLH